MLARILTCWSTFYRWKTKNVENLASMKTIGIQRMAATECIEEFQTSLEMFKQVFSLLDYFLDSELRSPKQPFVDALIAHPKSYVLNDAMLDGLNLILAHRTLLPAREDGKTNPSISRTLIAVFDVLDILAMSEEFVQKLLSRSQGYQLVDICLHIFKDHTRLGHPVLFATLKLLYRLCEEEATFLSGVLNSPACTRFNLVISHVIDVASDVLGPNPKLTHATRSEASKIIFAAAREPSYRRLILERGTPFFLKFLSLPPNDFSLFFKDAAASEMIVYVFATIGFLHAQPVREPLDKSLLDHALNCLQTQPSALLLKKAYSSGPSVYAPTIILNLNAIVHELLFNNKWREDSTFKLSKRHVNLALAFRNDVEKALGLNSSHFDSLIAETYATWGETPQRRDHPAAQTSIASNAAARQSSTAVKGAKPKHM